MKTFIKLDRNIEMKLKQVIENIILNCPNKECEVLDYTARGKIYKYYRFVIKKIYDNEFKLINKINKNDYHAKYYFIYKGFIVMDFIEGHHFSNIYKDCIRNKTKNILSHVIRKMAKKGVLISDLHGENIKIDCLNNPVIIDIDCYEFCHHKDKKIIDKIDRAIYLFLHYNHLK